MTEHAMTAEELDRYFDIGGNVTKLIKPGSIKFPNQNGHPSTTTDDVRRVNFNMPGWLVDALDKEAKHLAIPRQSVAIMWLAERARQEGLDL